jgi:hypothetical protein
VTDKLKNVVLKTVTARIGSTLADIGVAVRTDSRHLLPALSCGLWLEGDLRLGLARERQIATVAANAGQDQA